MHPPHTHQSEPEPPEPPTAAPTRTARLRQRIDALPPVVWPVGLGALGLLGATLLHFVDPNEPGNYPTCPWLLFTGTYCPGCGTMRAIALTTHLDITGALSMNPLLFLLAPYILWAYVRWFSWTIRPPKTPPKLTPGWFLWGMMIVITAHWVLRNLPWFSFLAPDVPLLPGW
ncbi:DUF2752 domain-containing protein [Nocardiopsis aegyptia]|uniref:DUF2752 domain-containing protein n=1 Tax=Nocardiopsis aegyptia TaxID=220378 RepID=UPI00366F01E6